MDIFLQVTLALSVLGLVHSYLFYPLLLTWLARGRKEHQPVFAPHATDWPVVSIIMSAYNEEAVIQEKLAALVRLQYPDGKLQVLIGSDCSSDRTDEIVSSFATKHPIIQFFPFQQRRGKPPVINELVAKAGEKFPLDAHHLLLITDASVIPTEEVVHQLAKHFKDERVGVVDARMVHTGMRPSGISRSEDHYISREGKVKYQEGVVWGKMIGPFGGCFILRSDLFSPVPANFLVDDFYLTMRVLEKGYLALSEPAAVCYEPVSHNISEEFRRKARISAGNFQNMMVFRHLWWPPTTPLGFAFFSHKILRWLGPFFLILIFLSIAGLAWMGNQLYQYLFLFAIGGAFFVILLDLGLKAVGVNLLLLRNVRYFVAMNMALLKGFFKFLNGIRSNVWEPTKRNQ